jgi:hypothetical protein
MHLPCTSPVASLVCSVVFGVLPNLKTRTERGRQRAGGRPLGGKNALPCIAYYLGILVVRKIITFNLLVSFLVYIFFLNDLFFFASQTAFQLSLSAFATTTTTPLPLPATTLLTPTNIFKKIKKIFTVYKL